MNRGIEIYKIYRGISEIFWAYLPSSGFVRALWFCQFFFFLRAIDLRSFTEKNRWTMRVAKHTFFREKY